MPKSKKSDSAKSEKVKATKPAKEKKSSAKKKSKAAEEAPVQVEKPAAKVAAKPVSIPRTKKTASSKKAEKEVVLKHEDIALRAYYIAERRAALGWPGDSTSDWIEAERQLREEALKGS